MQHRPGNILKLKQEKFRTALRKLGKLEKVLHFESEGLLVAQCGNILFSRSECLEELY